MQIKNPVSIADLKNLVNKVPGFYGDEYIVCHPDNLRLLKSLVSLEYNSSLKNEIFGYTERYFGLEIRTDVHVPKYAQRWEFPKTRFVEYEPSDEEWAKPIGFGHYVDTDEPVFYLVKDWKIFMDFQFYDAWRIPKTLITNIS